ncbi:interleukin-17 receptor B isoform X3 [Dipodomys spectabilis]|uniref:interleukin-17 receptor B isoform X3 n=1 Tax=Dipodomys spectabilis TaxID=105255 RepID=UPI001C5369D4|nr:interleukin-17 receptor B isoform X3 [Dipodomys spectabilis]
MSLVLLSLVALCRSARSTMPQEPNIQCGFEAGPSPEWMIQHTLTPGDLRDLRVEPVRTSAAAKDNSILMNISWTLRADASIRLLKATKICVTGKSHVQSYSCVRCNYTEAFQSQTRPSGGKWTFSYIGFPVELSTLYLIGAHNIPNANMNEDGPSLSVNFTSPGCLDHIMKYKQKCIDAGSLWEPNITACKKNEKMVEVNFTNSPLGDRYMILIQYNTSVILENKLTRTSVVIPVNGESEGAVVQVTPYFRTCGNDCIRRKGIVVLCPQTVSPSSPDNICYFTEFLQNHCRSEVVLEKWQKKRIAEVGPLQWLTTQKQASDKVIFLLSNAACDGACGQNECAPRENSQDLFPLAFNLFCSDLSSQTHLHKYMVVYFRRADIKDNYNALHVCPKYHLMKDANAFRTELLRVTPHVSVGKWSQSCHGSCSPL